MSADFSEPVTIALSRRKLLLALLASIAFVALGVWLVDPRNPFADFLGSIIGAASVSFFGACALFCCFKLLDTRPGLVIDEVGILDNSSAVAAGRIFWHEIIGFRISEISGQRFITIEVIDPKRFIDRCGFVMRFLNSANHDFVGSPINISSNALQADLDELVRLLVAWLEYRKKTNEPELPPPSSTQIRANGSRSQSE